MPRAAAAASQPRCCVIGPDLEAEAKGVFGLPFDELLTSKWVKDDSITFKVVVKEAPRPVQTGQWSAAAVQLL